MTKKLLTTTLITLALSTTSYAATNWTVAATDSPPTVTDDGRTPPQNDDTTINPDRNTNATSRAYPALDSDCRYVDGRKVCNGKKRMDNESNSATQPDSEIDDNESRSLNR